MNVSSIQIGENKIEIGNKYPICDYSSQVNLNLPFPQTTRYGITMWVATYTPTEDCYIRFNGKMASSQQIANGQNMYLIKDITDNRFIYSEHMPKDIFATYEHFGKVAYLEKNHTYEVQVIGFYDAAIYKFGFKKFED